MGDGLLIVKGDCEFLRRVAEPMDMGDLAQVRWLARRLISQMVKGGGIGLAAPQIGVSRQMFVYQTPDMAEPAVVVNPEVFPGSDLEVRVEGCLSLPGMEVRVPRALWVRIKAWDALGRMTTGLLTGLQARVVQHEFDHLQGKLIIDYLGDAHGADATGHHQQ